MKLKIKVPKPRNPIAMLARKRVAGAHTSDDPLRRSRREEKHRLHLLLKKTALDGNQDE